MRDRVQFRGVLNALDEIMGQFTRGAAGAISHTDKIWHVRFKIANRLIERLSRLWRFWGKELERKRRRMFLHDVGDMHESAVIFVPAATFGQLIPEMGCRKNTPDSSMVDHSFSAASFTCCQSREQCVSPGSRDYFGERMLAWVLMSRLCFSTTRRSSRSMVLNASWMTFLSGS